MSMLENFIYSWKNISSIRNCSATREISITWPNQLAYRTYYNYKLQAKLQLSECLVWRLTRQPTSAYLILFCRTSRTGKCGGHKFTCTPRQQTACLMSRTSACSTVREFTRVLRPCSMPDRTAFRTLYYQITARAAHIFDTPSFPSPLTYCPPK